MGEDTIFVGPGTYDLARSDPYCGNCGGNGFYIHPVPSSNGGPRKVVMSPCSCWKKERVDLPEPSCDLEKLVIDEMRSTRPFDCTGPSSNKVARDWVKQMAEAFQCAREAIEHDKELTSWGAAIAQDMLSGFQETCEQLSVKMAMRASASGEAKSERPSCIFVDDPTGV